MKGPKKTGILYEKMVAKMLTKYSDYTNVTSTVNSGTFWFSKEDLSAEKGENKYLIQVKGTKKDYYRIGIKDVIDLWTNAYDGNKVPLFMVLFDTQYRYELVIFDVVYSVEFLSNGKFKKSYKVDYDVPEYVNGVIANSEYEFSVVFKDKIIMNK